MDPILSTLFPSYKIGSDGFSWWIGQIEDVSDPKNSGRVKVRIVGIHHREGEVTSTDSLPWANVMMPVTTPFTDGNTTGATNNLETGCWVVGFFLDSDSQKPLVIGSIGHTKSSTFKEIETITPDKKELGFTRKKRPDIIPQIHRSANTQTGKNPDGSDVDSGIVSAGLSNQTAAVPPAVAALRAQESDTNPTGGKLCVSIADATCDSKDLGTGMKKIISELLKNNQSSGGNLGSYYVSRANGLLYSATDIPRKYISKINRLVTSFSLRVKKEIIFGIRDAVESLIKLVMGVESAKEIAEKAKDKPLNPKESYVPNTERGNFLKNVIDTFNKVLNEIGCSFSKTLDDLIKFIIDLIMNYLVDAFSEAFCLVDNIVNSIIKYIENSFNNLIQTVLGPLQALLGEAGSFLDIIGNVVNKVFSILGISCTGLKDDCNKNNTYCTDGGNLDKKENEEDFLDRLIKEIETGSVTGKELTGSFSRGVCNQSRNNLPTQKTSVFFEGGILNKPIKKSYVSKTRIIPDIPLSQPNFPNFVDLPSAIPIPDANRIKESDYKVTAVENKIKSGEVAQFQIDGPERNGVLEVEIIGGGSSIPSEANEQYEPCLIESGDGVAVGFEIQVLRDENGEPILTIVANGIGYLKGMEFTLNGSKIGGEDGPDDIRILVTLVGETINYRIFGDIYSKGLIDGELYPEFGTLRYTEPRQFNIPTIQSNSALTPSFIGLELLTKRAADTVTIWNEDPEDTYKEEEKEFKTGTLSTNKDVYSQGETIFYTLTVDGYPEGSVFDYEVFGSVSLSDYTLIDESKKITIESNIGKFAILTNIDTNFENDKSLTVIIFEEGTSNAIASKSVSIIDEEFFESDEFKLTENTTQEELQEYLNSLNLDVERDFGNVVVALPPELVIGGAEEFVFDEPDDFSSPIAGDPVVDSNGSVISIPIGDPGNRSFQIPPRVIISGAGSGAAAIALLDNDGFVSEIRVTRIGVGYNRNVPGIDNDLNCIIDSFTIIRPGFGYEEPPTLYVDGNPNIGEITIDENGFINGVRVLNRNTTYDTIPDIQIIGGGGAGGFVLPNLVCLPAIEIENRGYVKIGTGKYIDCP